MHLKKLEMFGFKSFADRTSLEFADGMTAVVGPNGCGKSNVVDAFKWIFGEQSAKGMRGSEMRDVIFNGTQIRKPTGFAEVTVVFDNQDRFLDVDFAEVAITRRLYRSGESEYLINKERCRLKDIKALTMDTGIGRTSYSILEQGRIDVLLQANQYDRRIIFEEAAGISKYRAKKAETLRALARVEDNLSRLNDVLDEVARRVQRLKSQASKAKRYRRYSDRLKELRVRAALESYKKSLHVRTDVSARLHWCHFSIRRLESLLARLQAKLDDRAQKRQQRVERARELREKFSSEQVLLERTRQKLEHATQRIAELEGEESRKLAGVSETQAAVSRVEEQMRAESLEIEEIGRAISAQKEAVETWLANRQQQREQSDSFQQQLRHKKDELVSVLQRRSRVANQSVQLDSELSNLQARSTRLVALVGELTERLEGERANESNEEKAFAALDVERQELEASCECLSRQLTELRQVGATVQGELEDKLSQLHQKQSRCEVLETLERNFEGVGRGVREILANEEKLRELGDAHGLLAALLKVERKYALAVEAILAERAQAFVVETHEGALELLDLARAEDVSSIEVICLDRVDVLPHEDYSRHEGVIGRLRDFVVVPDLFSELLDRLLANVLLVTDFDTAVSLSRNGLRPFRLVTLAGEVIEPWGALSIHGETELGLISRRSELEELKREVEQYTLEERQTRQRLSEVQRQIADKQAEWETATAALAENSRLRTQSEEKLAQVRRDVDRLQRESKVHADEDAELQAEIAQRAEKLSVLKEELKAIDSQEKACEEAIDSLEESVRSAADKLQESDESLTQARLLLAQSERREEGARELLKRQEATMAEKRGDLESLTKDIEALRARRGETQESVVNARQEAVQIEERVATLRSLVEAEEDAEAEMLAEEERFQQESDRLRSEISRLQKRREEAQLQDQEERHRRNNTLERMDEEYGLDLNAVLSWEPAVDAALRRLEEGDTGDVDGDLEGDVDQREVEDGAAADEVAAERVETSGQGAAESTAASGDDWPDRGKRAKGGKQSGEPSAEERWQQLEPLVCQERARLDAMSVSDIEAPSEAACLVPDPEWNAEESRAEMRTLQESMRRMGSVNLAALEELDELEQRFEFQRSQRDDLVESQQSLSAIIEDINVTSREKFFTSFTQVRENFSELFRKCFGGGKADLVLEDEDDVLESGIEIVARPPGKRISSLSLMSGGEKTMTTLALLFAIFKSRPCPFCILDEVDAPLDEVNVGRFIVLLSEFLESTQFIVVSHNKATMAEADTLYGVTMQERGVSTQVSVELDSYDPDAMERQAVRK